MTPSIFLECRTSSSPPDLVLTRRNLPSPKGKQVQVKIAATSINPIDVKRAAGYGRRLLRLKGAGKFPLVLGNDLVGEIVAVGPEVKGAGIGDRVMGVAPTGPLGGAHASHINISEDLVLAVIDGYTDDELAALPYAFTTLWLALRSIGLNPKNARGCDVLINGASGAIGQMATRLLVYWGCRITAVCSAANIETCRKLGAADVVDRHAVSISAIPSQFDFALNFGSWADEQQMIARLKPTAIGCATTCHPLMENCDRFGLVPGLLRSWLDFARLRRETKKIAPHACYSWTVFKPDRAALLDLSAWLEARILSLPIGFSAGFDQAAGAYAHVASGRPGKAILQPG